MDAEYYRVVRVWMRSEGDETEVGLIHNTIQYMTAKCNTMQCNTSKYITIQ